jgi:hypothetical protein
MDTSHYLRADSASVFGAVGRHVEQALAAYAAAPIENPAVHRAMRYAAADAVWQFFVVREACGLNEHTPVIEAYHVPPEILALVGSVPPPDGRGDA